MDNNAIVEELNQLLKGTHMGIGIFEDLEGKLQLSLIHISEPTRP